MAKHTRMEIGLLILAGVGAGTLIGAAVGLALGRRAVGRDGDEMTGTVDELREQAQQVLGELSENVSHLVTRSREILDETGRREARPGR